MPVTQTDQLEQIVPIFWDQELDRLTARDTGRGDYLAEADFCRRRLGWLCGPRPCYGRQDPSGPSPHRKSASESRHRLYLNGRHPQDEREYFRELVLQAATHRFTRLPRSRAPVQLAL